MMPPTKAGSLVAAMVVATLHATTAVAQESEPRVRIGGFGSVAYGSTTGYPYLGGTDRGEFNNAQYSILLTSAVSDRMTTAALVDLTLRGETHDVDFSYAFASWRITPSLELRLGRVKHPGMLYSEVFNVGTTRPFLTLPPAIYGETGHAFENYTGAGLHGWIYPGSWQVGVTLFGGGGLYRYHSPVVDALAPDDQQSRIPVRDLAGGRLTIRPPVNGLSLGVSAARGVGHPSYSDEQLFQSVAAQVEYLTSRVWLRAEAAHLGANMPFRFRSSASFAEAAAFITAHWQATLLIDRVRDQVPTELPSTVQRHDGRAFGLNYWVSPNFVVKASAHVARGNRLAWPRHGDLLPALAGGGLRSTTRLIQVGAQYSY
jgi:hypothetical protein